MRKLILAGAIAGMMVMGAGVQSGAMAQTDTGRYNPGAVDSVAGIDSTLWHMPKVELARVFLTEVSRVTETIAHLPLDSTGGDVPKNKYTQCREARVGAKVKTYNAALMEHYAVIIPYADRAAIIAAIVYMRSIPAMPK